MSGQGAAIGAATGATYALATGKDPIKYAMIGGAVGGGAPGAASALGLTGTTAASLTPAAAGTTAGTATGNAITASAGGSAAGNLTAVPAYGVPSFQVGASAVPSAGVFSTPAQVSAFQPLSSAAGQTAGMERTFGPVESLLNPNIQSSSLNDESLLQKIGTGASELGQYAQQNPVLTAMAAQSAQQMMQQPQRRSQPPGLLRGTQMQASAPQYQVGVPQVSLI